MPFTSSTQAITFQIKTSTGFTRDEQVYSYNSDTGTFPDASVNCYTLEIGYYTTCFFNATLVHNMLSSDKLVLIFPSGFSINSNTNFEC